MANTWLIWDYIITGFLHDISRILARIVLIGLYIFYMFVIVGIIMIYITCYTNYMSKMFNVAIRFAIVFLFPINVMLGKCFGIKKDRIRESFVQLNNSFLKCNKKLAPEDILILLPHCLQNNNCNYRITNNIDNCQNCGECPILKLKSISQTWRVKIVIATGGTLARKIIVQTKPKCIVAVACQRDLVDGLIDVFPIPVYGLLNERPEGPCVNTSVDIDKLENFLIHYCNEIN